ncbi:hypothetical protein BT69DRAFT_1282173 [Atractiella rhizophila]|nr:hypothetical protein BT69DRAFT_1282173 [Atractiella rhizophila]
MELLPDPIVTDDSIDGMTSFLELWIQQNCSVIRLDGSQQDTRRIESIEQTLQFLVNVWKIRELDAERKLLDLKATILNLLERKEINSKLISPVKLKASNIIAPNKVRKKTAKKVLRELSVDPVALVDRQTIWTFLRMLGQVKVEDIRHLTIRTTPGNIFDDTAVLKIIGLCSRITTLSLNWHPTDGPDSKIHNDLFSKILQALEPVNHRIRTLYLVDDGSEFFWTAMKTFSRITHLTLLSGNGNRDTFDSTITSHLGPAPWLSPRLPESDMDLSSILPAQLTGLRLIGSRSSLLTVLKHIKQIDAPFPRLSVFQCDFHREVKLLCSILEAISPTIQDLSLSCGCFYSRDGDSLFDNFYRIIGNCKALISLTLSETELPPWDSDSPGLFQPPLQRLSLKHCMGKGLDWGLWRTALKTSHIRSLTLDSESYATSISATEKWSSTRTAIVKYCQRNRIELVLPKGHRRK